MKKNYIIFDTGVNNDYKNAIKAVEFLKDLQKDIPALLNAPENSKYFSVISNEAKHKLIFDLNRLENFRFASIYELRKEAEEGQNQPLDVGKMVFIKEKANDRQNELVKLYFGNDEAPTIENSKLYDFENLLITESLNYTKTNKIIDLLRIISEKQDKKVQILPVNCYIDEIFDEYKENQKHGKIDTGIKSFNDLLNGGLERKRLYALTGDTGTGKTAFVMQVADYIASNCDHNGNIKESTPVLYFSLEMPRSELLARSLARIAFNLKVGGYRLTADDFIYNNVRNDQREQTLKYYRGNIGENINIIEFDGYPTTKEIEKYIDAAILTFRKTPIVIIDYLQLLATEDYKSEFETMAESATLLKQLARRYKTSIIVLSAMPRPNYGKSAAEQTNNAFYGSSRIEYTCDYTFILCRKYLEENKGKVKPAEPDGKRNNVYFADIQLKNMKFRGGRMIENVDTKDLKFYGGAAFFECKEQSKPARNNDTMAQNDEADTEAIDEYGNNFNA